MEHSSAKENPMEPIVLALASNERYFPGLYCAVASALSHLDAAREVNLKVLDGGISQRPGICWSGSLTDLAIRFAWSSCQ